MINYTAQWNSCPSLCTTITLSLFGLVNFSSLFNLTRWLHIDLVCETPNPTLSLGIGKSSLPGLRAKSTRALTVHTWSCLSSLGHLIHWLHNPSRQLRRLRGNWVTPVLNCLLATWYGNHGHSFSTWCELSLNNCKPHADSCNSCVRHTPSQHPRMTIQRLRGHPESDLLTLGYPGTLPVLPPLLKHFLVKPDPKTISSFFVGFKKKT